MEETIQQGLNYMLYVVYGLVGLSTGTFLVSVYQHFKALWEIDKQKESEESALESMIDLAVNPDPKNIRLPGKNIKYLEI